MDILTCSVGTESDPELYIINLVFIGVFAQTQSIIDPIASDRRPVTISYFKSTGNSDLRGRLVHVIWTEVRLSDPKLIVVFTYRRSYSPTSGSTKHWPH